MSEARLIVSLVRTAALCLVALGLAAGCDKDRPPQKSDDQQDSSRSEQSSSAEAAPEASLEDSVAAVAEDLVLAASTSPFEPVDDQPGARVALEQVTMGMMQVDSLTYPSKRIRDFELRNRQIATREVQTRGFAREQLADADAAWTDKVEGVVEDYVAFREKQGHSTAAFSFTVAVDQTVPAAELAHLLEAAREAGVARFELLVRRVDALDEEPSADAQIAKIDVLSSPGLEAPPPSKPLVVTVTPDGFDLYWDGRHVAPLAGCEPSGQTVCLAVSDVDSATKLKKARALQKNGEFEASERHVRKVLAAYDWERLYGQLVEWKEALPSQSRLHIVPRQDVSVAAVLRVMEIAQFHRDSSEPLFERLILTKVDPARLGSKTAPGVKPSEVTEIDVEKLPSAEKMPKEVRKKMLSQGPLSKLFGKDGSYQGKTSEAASQANAATPKAGNTAKADKLCEKSYIRSVIAPKSYMIQMCYERVLQMDPSLGGKVVAKWTVNADGKVQNPSIASSTLDNRDAESCIRGVIRRLRFKKQGGSCSIKYPFVFSSDLD
jgi:hypothetical protein